MTVTLTTVELEKLIANAIKAALSAQVEQEKIDVPLMSGEEVEPEGSVALPLSLPAVSEQGVEPEVQGVISDREEVNVNLGDAQADIPVGEVGDASLGVAQADIDVDVSLGDAQGVISDREEVNGTDFYEELFDLDSNDKMSNKDHETIRKSLKTQTFLSKADRLPSERFAPFMREFSSEMFFLQKATNEAIREIYKNHNMLFQATVRSAFSKWTGMNFLTPSERKKPNHIQVGNKNFAEKILGSTKLLGGNK